LYFTIGSARIYHLGMYDNQATVGRPNGLQKPHEEQCKGGCGGHGCGANHRGSSGNLWRQAGKEALPASMGEVRSDSTAPYWYLPSGLDPNYFSPSEVAFAFHTNSDDANRQLDEKFQKLQFRNPVRPGSTEAGFALVNLDQGFRAVDIDLISRDDATSFSFIIAEPGFNADDKMVDFNTLYSSGEITNLCGQKLFVGQISRDIGVNFTLKSPMISTHVIDTDVDKARRYFVEDLAYSQALA